MKKLLLSCLVLVSLSATTACSARGADSTSAAPLPAVTSAPAPAVKPLAPTLNLALSSEDVLEHPVLQFLTHTKAMVRDDVFWRDSTPLAETDFARTLADVKAAGRTMLAVLDYAPAQYAAENCPDDANCGGSASSADAYAKFAGSVAAHCVATGSRCHYELWNEPNIAQFWAPAANPAAYAKLACAAYRAIKQTDPIGTVLLGGTSPGSSGNGNFRPAAFMKLLYDNGIAGCFDAVATHPYDGLDQTRAVYQVMSDHGDSGKQIWATEFGFESNALPNTAAAAGERTRFNQLFADWQAEPYAGPAFWYTWADDRVPDNIAHESFGLMTKADHPKAVAAAFLSAA